MNKRRNKSVVGTIAVLMIVILLFTTLTEAKELYRAPGAPPSAEATGVSASAQQAAAGKPDNERYKVTVGDGADAKTYVYGSLDEIKKDKDVADEIKSALTNNPSALPSGVTTVFKTPIGHFEKDVPMPSNPGFKMDGTTGEFTLLSGGSTQVLKPDGDGNYEIYQGKDKIVTGRRTQLRDDDGQPIKDADAYVIQETDHAQNRVAFRVADTVTSPMPLDMYKKLFIDKDEMIKGVKPNADGSTLIETVSGATFSIETKPLVPKVSETVGGSVRPSAGAAGIDQGAITDIEVTTVAEKRGTETTDHEHYGFVKTGITSEEIDGNVVLVMKDGTKIYTGKKPGDEFKDVISTGTIPVKVQGKSYDYTMTHDAATGQVVYKRNAAEEAKKRAETLAIDAAMKADDADDKFRAAAGIKSKDPAELDVDKAPNVMEKETELSRARVELELIKADLNSVPFTEVQQKVVDEAQKKVTAAKEAASKAESKFNEVHKTLEDADKLLQEKQQALTDANDKLTNAQPTTRLGKINIQNIAEKTRLEGLVKDAQKELEDATEKRREAKKKDMGEFIEKKKITDALTAAEKELEVFSAVKEPQTFIDAAQKKINEAEDARDTTKEEVEAALKELTAANSKKESREKARAVATYESGEIIPNFDGTTTEIRYTKDKDDKIVDFESSVTTDPSGRVTAKVERTKSGISDVGKIDLGILGKWGGNEGTQLKKTVYGADGKTYTQVSTKKFTVNDDGSINPDANFDPKDPANFGADSKLINYDPGTGEIMEYPGSFNPQDSRLNPESSEYDPAFAQSQGTVKTKLGTNLRLVGLFGGIPADVEKKIKESGLTPEQQQAALAEYKEGAAKDRAARIANAQDYAQSFGQLSSLFADSHFFTEWNRKTDAYFNNIIMGGSDYRISKACESNLKKIGDNVLLVQTPGGQLVTAAFVNGERQAFGNPYNDSIIYLYKISYKVNIPESLIDTADVRQRTVIRAVDDPKPTPEAQFLGKTGKGDYIYRFLAEGPFFNVWLSGTSPKKCLFIDSGTKLCEEESVKKGASAIQRNMFVQYSRKDFNRVCIEFTRSIEFSNRYANSICADIVDVNQQARDIIEVPEQETAFGDGSGGKAAPGLFTTATGTIVPADLDDDSVQK
ncbi:hypothetical protein J4206_03215 [Candidatus Woesearchaeota archaeon]|nr:hypothetical protein [Candidatus Woesearchaeota archaeon]